MASVQSKSSSKDRRQHEGVKKVPTQSRLRNPLNVVVDRISATRAMVHGDVSVESLRELLMSSLSLLPTMKSTTSDRSVTTESGYSNPNTEIWDKSSSGTRRHLATHGEEDGRGVDKGGEVSGGRGNDNFNAAKLRDKERRTRTNEGTKRSKKSRFGERGSKPRFEPSSKSSVEENGEEERAEKEESLPSCLSVLITEEASFSCDSRWLRGYFGRVLIQGLKNIAQKKPEDPVSWLAFFLRRYRSLEEERRRIKAFDNDLRTQRSLLATLKSKEENPREPGDYFLEGEEGGGPTDTNFQNYHLNGSKEIY